MADVRKVLIEIDAKTGNVVGGIASVNKQLSQLGATAKITTKEVDKAADALQKKMAGSAGIAGAAATELGRTISDLPFGISAVTNNISQLGNMFALLVTSAGGFKNALTALKTTLMGPVGILVAFQAVVAGVEFFAQSQRKAKKETEEATVAFNEQAVAIENLIASYDITRLVSELDFLVGDEGVGKSIDDLKKRLNDVVNFLIQKSPEFKEAFENLTPQEQNDTEMLKALVTEFGNIIRVKNIIRDLNKQLEQEGLTENEIADIQSEIVNAELSLMNRVQDFKTRMTQEFDTPIDTFYNFGKDMFFEIDKGFEDALMAESESFLEKIRGISSLTETSEEPYFPYVDMLKLEGILALEQEVENNEKLKKEREKAAKERLDIEIATIDALAGIKMAEADIVESVFRTIADISEKSRFIQALALVGESAAGIAKIIIDTKAANAAITLQQSATVNPFIISALQARKKFNNMSAAAGIAANVGATATALSRLRAPVGSASSQSLGGSESGSSGGGAPEFNVIGATGQNQLAAAIAGTQQGPMRAYVVAGDVTTAQSLERNIVTEASI